MFKYLVPVGIAALFLSALTLSAQVGETPARPGAPEQPGATPKKTVTTDKDTPDRAPADKNARRRSRSRVYLGVYTIPVEDMSRRVKKRLQIKEEDGVVVVEVMPDSPAEEAGLKHGDVITHVNGKPIEDEDELSEDLNELGPGKKVSLRVVREGKKKEIAATLQESPAEPFAPPFGEQGGIGGAPKTNTPQERLQRLERLERKVSRLEKRVEELTKTHSANKP